MRSPLLAAVVVALACASSSMDAQTWTAQSVLAVNVDFVSRVKMATVAAAIAITTEPANTPNHDQRAILARAVATDPTAYANRFAVGVAADITISLGSSDAVLNSRVAAIWNTYAGVGQ